MQRAVLLLVLAAAVSASQVTPVQKVVDMMEKMVEKGRTEMEEEKAQFAVYVTFCENTTVEKRRAIEEATERIDILTANIDKAASDIDQLTQEISEADAIIDSTSAEKDNATSVRKGEAADYAVALKDYTDSINAIGKAMKVLQDQNYNRPQATSLLQLTKLADSKKISPSEASQFLDDFLKDRTEDAQVSSAEVPKPERHLESLLAESEAQPAAEGYEFQSGGVTGLLEKMEDQFKQERNDLKMAELKKKNAYNSLVAQLDAENSDATGDKDRKSQEKARISEQKAQDEGELEETSTTKAEDIKYKKDLEISWQQKTSEFNNRQKLRTEELEAVSQAIEIISGESVAGSATKHLPTLLQADGATALALLGSERTMLRTPSVKKVAQFLQDRADSLHSQQLAALALRVTADPIEKVKQMMQDMVASKQQQASAEATKQAWCEEELSSNEATRSEKSDEVEGLQAEVEQLQASIQQLGDDVSSLNQQLTEMKSAMSEATDIRQKEKKENSVAIADAQAAQAAVAQALGVLNEFYAKAGQATAFAQQSSVQPAPEAFESKPYKGMGAESGGVIGMIEVIQSDFARLEAETTAAEEAAAKEYEGFMDDSKLDIAGKDKDVEHKTLKSEALSQKMREKTDDMNDVQKELDSALKTFEELKPQCADATASYEERKAQRDAEIKSLEEALDAITVAR